MSHMVIYRSADGKPGFQQTDDLVAAVEFVERLRNLEGVETARIYRLEQVNFRFQPYYQVHLESGEAPVAPQPVVTASQPLVTASQPVVTASQPFAATPEPAPQVVSAAAAAEAAPAPPSFEPPAAAAAPLGTVGSEPVDANGIRRGLFGR